MTGGKKKKWRDALRMFHCHSSKVKGAVCSLLLSYLYMVFTISAASPNKLAEHCSSCVFTSGTSWSHWNRPSWPTTTTDIPAGNQSEDAEEEQSDDGKKAGTTQQTDRDWRRFQTVSTYLIPAEEKHSNRCLLGVLQTDLPKQEDTRSTNQHQCESISVSLSSLDCNEITGQSHLEAAFLQKLSTAVEVMMSWTQVPVTAG